MIVLKWNGSKYNIILSDGVEHEEKAWEYSTFDSVYEGKFLIGEWGTPDPESAIPRRPRMIYRKSSAMGTLRIRRQLNK